MHPWTGSLGSSSLVWGSPWSWLQRAKLLSLCSSSQAPCMKKAYCCKTKSLCVPCAPEMTVINIENKKKFPLQSTCDICKAFISIRLLLLHRFVFPNINMPTRDTFCGFQSGFFQQAMLVIDVVPPREDSWLKEVFKHTALSSSKSTKSKLHDLLLLACRASLSWTWSLIVVMSASEPNRSLMKALCQSQSQ